MVIRVYFFKKIRRRQGILQRLSVFSLSHIEKNDRNKHQGSQQSKPNLKDRLVKAAKNWQGKKNDLNYYLRDKKAVFKYQSLVPKAFCVIQGTKLVLSVMGRQNMVNHLFNHVLESESSFLSTIWTTIRLGLRFLLYLKIARCKSRRVSVHVTSWPIPMFTINIVGCFAGQECGSIFCMFSGRT